MKKLVVLTYTPRPLDEDEYAQFIRDTDYPAFRQNPHILDYTCWRHVENVLGGEQQFSHFDLMEIDDFGNWPRILEDPRIQENLDQWARRWSQHGPGGDNFKATFAERYWG